MSERELDLVLLGATGFVGRLTAAHLARSAPPGTRIALAGRSLDRLAATRSDLGAAAESWPLRVVDVGDVEAVRRLAAATRVLVSTVGPYLRHGMPVVRACADAGTHYADLTGETLFVRRSIDECYDAARSSGARIVHACGFDSIPSDLGLGLAADAARSDGATRLSGALLRVRSLRGGFSGGTIDSLRQQLIDVGDDPSLRPVVSSQLALTSVPPHSRSVRRPAVDRDPRTGRWQAPFVMGAYNGQIVQRTNELTGWAYGRDLSYTEVVDTGAGARGLIAAGGLAFATAALMTGMAFGPSRRVLDRVLPDPGQGPSERTRARGRFVVEIDAWTHDGACYRTSIADERDPGYDGTAVLLGESALALLDDEGLPDCAGVLTPMSALGVGLADRLRRQGVTITTGVVQP